MANTHDPAKIKKLISDPKNRIELHDLVHQETEKLYELISGMSVNKSGEAKEAASAFMKQVEDESKTLREIFAYGCFFGTEEQAYIWTKSLNRLGKVPHNNGLRVMLNLQLYPAMLVLYSGGLSATVADNAPSLKALLTSTTSEPHEKPRMLAYKANCWLLDANVANEVLGLERRKTPISDHVHDVLKATFPKSLTGSDSFSLDFDKWEVILGMSVAHNLKETRPTSWAPVGRFSWRHEDSGATGLSVIEDEINSQHTNWSPFKTGLFGSKLEDVKEAHKFVVDIADQVGF